MRPLDPGPLDGRPAGRSDARLPRRPGPEHFSTPPLSPTWDGDLAAGKVVQRFPRSGRTTWDRTDTGGIVSLFGLTVRWAAVVRKAGRWKSKSKSTRSSTS